MLIGKNFIISQRREGAKAQRKKIDNFIKNCQNLTTDEIMKEREIYYITDEYNFFTHKIDKAIELFETKLRQFIKK